MANAATRYEAAATRRQRILAALQERGFTSVNDLAEQLGVSSMTVRRDLRRLEQPGAVRIVHGGVSLPHSTFRSSFVTRAETNADGKRAIGRRAADLVGNADTVAVDAGTTAYELAVALPESFSGLVVTHSIPVIQFMLGRPEVRLIALGGELLAKSHAFAGSLTVQTAHRLRVRTFFLGAAAVDERGVYAETDAECPTKRALMDIADEVVLLADYTKFSVSAPVLLCPPTRLAAIVTDNPPPAKAAAWLRKASTEIVVA